MIKRRLRLFVHDPHARGAFFLVGGTAFHFLYGSFRLIMGVLYRAYYIDITAFFYLTLAVSRLFLLRAYWGDEEETTACRYAGRMLFFTVGIMLLLIAETVAGGGRSPYPFYALLVSGGYALTSASLAIAELLYLRRLNSPLLSASRAVGLASTLFSIFGFLSDVLLSVAILPSSLRDALHLTFGAMTLLFVLFLAVGLSHKKKTMRKR
ncbi:MAG: hypothetical protein E7609_00100 [Ruminococcaceae bacterium]|nr:hypothetical protein [Oscillospiraceae bacterium]